MRAKHIFIESGKYFSLAVSSWEQPVSYKALLFTLLLIPVKPN
jgi:hypothetical protein